MILRWGIASAGKISNDFVNALQVYPESSHKVVAVAAKALDRAQEFANKFKIPKAYEGYQALATDPEIGIYIFLQSIFFKFAYSLPFQHFGFI